MHVCPSLPPARAPDARSSLSKLLKTLWLGLLLVCAQTTWAQNHIVDQGWLEDPSRQLTFADVQRLPTQPYSGVLSRGFGDSAVWVRLRIDPWVRPASQREPDRLILRIRPVYLDDIQVFDPLVPGGRAGQTGDIHSPRGQEFEGLDFMLPIARGHAPRDVWLRLTSTSTRQMAVQAVHIDDLNQFIYSENLIFALYIGVILIFMVWGVVYWFFSRERVIGAFALMQAMALMYALGSLGYTRVFWPEAWPAYWLHQATSLFSMLSVNTAIYFHMVLLREFDLPRPMIWVLRALLVLLPTTLVLYFAANLQRVALQVNMIAVLLAPAVFLASA